MILSLSTRRVGVVLAAAMVVSLASCGRKGPLEPPSARTATEPPPDESPEAEQEARPRPAQPRPFPLDPML